MNDLELARLGVEKAVAAGATAADVIVAGEESHGVRVRDGVTEKVQYSNARSLGVRALVQGRSGLTYTNDVTEAGAAQAAAQAVELARIAAPDEHAGLPGPTELAHAVADLDLLDPTFASVGPDELRDLALAAEAAAREEPRITRSEGARAAAGSVSVALANSLGFAGERRATSYSLYASMFATGEHGERQRDGWSARATHLSDLESAESLGRRAAARAVRRCGWRRPPSGAVPVVFSPEIARDFAHSLASALAASSVFRGTTFLAESLGEEIASSELSLVDDATLARRPGSRPFDGEGVRCRRTALIEKGRVASWLSDCYSARRASFHTTGSALRAVGGEVSVGTSNLVLEPGVRAPEELVADVANGLYVTDLFGFGVNLAAGTWSRGGSGIWIEKGALAHPVQEFTIAGDLRAMLAGVREVANDLEWLGSSAAPTLLIDGLTVAAGA